ncbi:MAG TPA: SDR family oxidoreductase [Caulobacteraceae bacterium]|nr:SDR family oxidoreductase [Caulobacteraceae bacterium]
MSIHVQTSSLRVAITGGTSGLGLALVRAFVRRGAKVAFVARTTGAVAQVAAETGAVGIVADVARKDDIHRIALQVGAALGGLDVLINNASDLGPTPLALLADTDCEVFERALQTNLLGPFRLARALLGQLAGSAREGRGGVIVNISSDAAVTPYETWGAYGASKAALHHLSRIWDVELAGEGVRVLSLDPGDMDTPMHLAAIPGANRAALQRPQDAAEGIVAAVLCALPSAVEEIAS